VRHETNWLGKAPPEFALNFPQRGKSFSILARFSFRMSWRMRLHMPVERGQSRIHRRATRRGPWPIPHVISSARAGGFVVDLDDRRSDLLEDFGFMLDSRSVTRRTLTGNVLPDVRQLVGPVSEKACDSCSSLAFPLF
jgi:hypothetical protein